MRWMEIKPKASKKASKTPDSTGGDSSEESNGLGTDRKHYLTDELSEITKKSKEETSRFVEDASEELKESFSTPERGEKVQDKKARLRRVKRRLVKRRTLAFIKSPRKMLVALGALGLVVALGWYFEIDRTIVGAVLIAVAFITEAFTLLIGAIGLVPVVGTVAAKLLAGPIIWILNALGYFVSVVAIKKGFKKDVLNYRVVTIIFLIGIVLGYVLGKLV